MARILQVHPSDNVLVALEDLPAGASVTWYGVDFVLPQAVPVKHKFATEALDPGQDVTMYGVLAGRAVARIEKGERITTSNLRHAAGQFGKRSGAFSWSPPNVDKWRNRTFMGYHRADGQIGTANYWLVLPLVFCENRNVDVLRSAFERALGYSTPDVYYSLVSELVDGYRSRSTNTAPTDAAARTDNKHASSDRFVGDRVFSNVDGVRFLTHEGGCGGTRQDAHALCGLLSGYLNNPNVAGATVLSLGCQHAQVEMLRKELAKRNAGFSKPLLVFEQQRYHSEREMLTDAIRQTFAGIAEADRVGRRPAPLSALTVGVECGGSDGFSGISANPAIGRVSDLVLALGGKAVLSEFPELCGVEQDLIDRCVDDETADRFADLMRRYEARAEAAGSGFDMNPSPGNIRDGLITDAMKSAGAAKKGGTGPVADVLDYPEYVRRGGLTLLCTPGNDVESTTAMAGAGCNIMLFSTGLGTPTGNPITPVIKVSTNSSLAGRMPDIIDYDAGSVIGGGRTIDEAGDELFELVIRVASGEVRTKAEKLEQYDFIPWKRGVSL